MLGSLRQGRNRVNPKRVARKECAILATLRFATKKPWVIDIHCRRSNLLSATWAETMSSTREKLMTMKSRETLNPIDWRSMHALGLPAGSIRALLAVLVFGTVWGMLLVRPSQEVPDYLSDLMFVIMGHYFATRKRSAAIGVSGDEPGPPPLFLPRGSIRLVLAAGSTAVAAVLYQRGVFARIDRNPGVTTLLLIGGFLFGVILNTVVGWWRARVNRGHRSIEDVQALVAVAAGLVLVALVWNRLIPIVPPADVDAVFKGWGHLGRLGPEHLLAAVIGFYYGSRS